ncbi:MAG: hypothetical protein IKE21_01265 [Erysipelotrichaceae bacterium]|nr:hypothetical protein [Erysipelotrichaceae bacterium]
MMEYDEIDEYDLLDGLVRRILRRYGVDPDEDENLVDAVIEDCEDTFQSLLEDSDYAVDLVMQDEELLEEIRTSIRELLGKDHSEEGYEEEEWEFLAEEDLDPEIMIENEDLQELPQENDPAGFEMFSDNDLLYSRPSYLLSEYTLAKDGDTKTLGHSRQNRLIGRFTNHYDNDHRIIGYSRKNYLSDRYTNYYDEKGHLLGVSRKSVINDLYTNYYDKNGRYLGSSRKSLLNSDWRRYFKKK